MNKKIFIRNSLTPSKGFTLVEMALVIIVIGIIISSVQSYYSNGINAVNQTKIKSIIASISESVVSFAILNHRLPCADINANGYEGGMSRTCGIGTLNTTGSVPYKTLKMNFIANSQNQRVKKNIVYGVYRHAKVLANNDADLAINKERTGSAASSQSYKNNFDFIKALANAQNSATNSQYIYTTGVAANEKCGNVIDANYAFIIASAGVEDADNDNNVFDGVNKNLSLSGTGTHCFSSPFKRQSSQYDDLVITMDFSTLIGRLNANN